MGQEQPPSQGRKRTVGATLGGWARRVGEIIGEATGQSALPEGLRERLDEARALRFGGAPAQGLAMLGALVGPAVEHPMTKLSMALCYVHEGLRDPLKARGLYDLTEQVGDTLGASTHHLLTAADAIFQAQWDAGLDELRRASRDHFRLPETEGTEARFLIHLLASIAHHAMGRDERTLRELQKAKARLPADAGDFLRRLVLSRGVDHLLAAGLNDEAEQWVGNALMLDPDDRDALELLLKVRASRGDQAGAHAAWLRLEPPSETAQLWVALTVGLPDDAPATLPELALALLQQAPEEPGVRRLWALAQLRRCLDDPKLRLAVAEHEEVIAALLAATNNASKSSRDGHLQELAHAILRFDAFVPEGVQAVMDRLRHDEATAAEELRLVRARHKLAHDRAHELERDFVQEHPIKFRADPDVGGPWGPDPVSPLRNDDIRLAVVASQRLLTAAQMSIARGDRAAAEDLLVAALVEWPQLAPAGDLLAQLALPAGDPGLEDALAQATRLLAGVPARVCGLALTDVGQALSRVVAARERLARPLTIAVMGEFSAGKSTFVNALLGEAVAPMGVLPTTTTINVFRRGGGDGARVHYRDGHVDILGSAEVHRFLQGLDSVQAASIRHVEIDRSGARMGDAAVVDTPGLNALDGFHEKVAREFVDQSDAIIWLFSATRSGAASEAGMLADLRAGGRRVLGVLNKVDTLDEAEQVELADYLRQQLGEVLVEVVPLAARAALEYRTGEHEGVDPFIVVEQALERQFLAHARELKRALTIRHLRQALDLAQEKIESVIGALDERSEQSERADQFDSPANDVLDWVAGNLSDGIRDMDDFLVREGLALGVLRVGRAPSVEMVDRQDMAYLHGCFREAAVAALQRTLVGCAQRDTLACEALDRDLVPWTRGYLEGLIAAGYVDELYTVTGAAISQGEAAAREAFRAVLDSVAHAVAIRVREMVPTLHRARQRVARAEASAPAAEAIRLRATVLLPLDALRRSVGELER